mmetsp:Transcript_2499/g.6236  ORF Transcript_2499/g.6236 Transcript_2499/m.6236 type:complete len:226 (+) Transcript_2499:1046-1723(+)
MHGAAQGALQVGCNNMDRRYTPTTIRPSNCLAGSTSLTSVPHRTETKSRQMQRRSCNLMRMPCASCSPTRARGTSAWRRGGGAGSLRSSSRVARLPSSSVWNRTCTAPLSRAKGLLFRAFTCETHRLRWKIPHHARRKSYEREIRLYRAFSFGLSMGMEGEGIQIRPGWNMRCNHVKKSACLLMFRARTIKCDTPTLQTAGLFTESPKVMNGCWSFAIMTDFARF